jgi:hypothetical protein
VGTPGAGWSGLRECEKNSFTQLKIKVIIVKYKIRVQANGAICGIKKCFELLRFDKSIL